MGLGVGDWGLGVWVRDTCKNIRGKNFIRLYHRYRNLFFQLYDIQRLKRIPVSPRSPRKEWTHTHTHTHTLTHTHL